MHDDSALTLPRLARLQTEHLIPARYRRTAPVRITAWTAPGEPVPFAEAVRQDYRPFSVGQPWGRPWGTVWFRVSGDVPPDWADQPGTGVELVVDLGWPAGSDGFSAEATAYDAAGTILKGVEPRNAWVPVPSSGPVERYLEAAANPDVAGHLSFAPTPYGDLATAGAEPLYQLRRLELGLLDREVWELEQDLSVLVGLVQQLPDGARRAQILTALARLLDVVEPGDVTGSAAPAREVLAPVLSCRAHASAHHVYAVGHAHIDSAWLWPTRETVRKVARTFASVCDLIDTSAATGEHRGFTFAASSAQQYRWLRDAYPELFERVRRHVAAGRFVPVGGMWVEADTNLPGGEALVRQFVYGQRFFVAAFGAPAPGVWLPDSFGYSAALPQLAVGVGAGWFLTQKLSWNSTDTLPHHTFTWEGIDGTRIFTHFPPADTYGSDLSAADLARAERQYAEKGVGTRSMLPFGYGDGGGGPTREMLAVAERLADLEGSPQVELSGPDDFFAAARAELAHPPVWSGELYLEFHRGTYTSQARTKRGNRRCEHLLREAELWATTATVRTGAAYPYGRLDTAWQIVLLQQFHDILPGSSIAWVHQEAERNYADVEADLEELIVASLRRLAGVGELALSANAGPYPVNGVAGLGVGVARRAADPTTIETDGAGWVLANAAIRVRVDHQGLIRSLVDVAADRELVPTGTAANLLQLHRDAPARWDAWDLDEQYRRVVTDLVDVDAITAVATADAGAGLRIERRFGNSAVGQTLTLEPGEPVLHVETDVDWHERRRLLKLAIPLDLLADRATSEIQFGHVHRPTHVNTSWDAARFETVAHRWVHVGETGYGVAVANDATYGHDVTRAEPSADHPAATTTVRLSLLRAPTYPDPTADQGRHVRHVSVRLGAGIGDAVALGYRRNLPLRTVPDAAGPVSPLVSVSDPAVVVEAVKLAEDGSGDVVVRLYESRGSRARTRVRAGFDTVDVHQTDLLERPIEPFALRSADGASARLELRPFQLVTLRFGRPLDVQVRKSV